MVDALLMKLFLLVFAAFTWTMAGIEVAKMYHKPQKIKTRAIDSLEIKTDMMMKNNCLIDSLLKS